MSVVHKWSYPPVMHFRIWLLASLPFLSLAPAIDELSLLSMHDHANRFLNYANKIRIEEHQFGKIQF